LIGVRGLLTEQVNAAGRTRTAMKVLAYRWLEVPSHFQRKVGFQRSRKKRISVSKREKDQLTYN